MPFKRNQRAAHWTVLLVIFAVLLGACTTPSATDAPPVNASATATTVPVTEDTQAPTAIQSTTGPDSPTTKPPTETPVPTATNTPVPPRDLVVCLGEEPDSLYPYQPGVQRARLGVLQALYESPIDQLQFDYVPVLIDQVPRLDNGGATLQPVNVSAGQQVVDDLGDIVTLREGLKVRPAGCQSGSCAVVYDGGPLQMDQLVVTFHLIDGLHWSDGTPMRAQDSVYAYDLAAHPDTLTDKYKINRTALYAAVDNQTIQWTGLPGFLDTSYFTNIWTPLPQHLWGSLDANALKTAEISSRMPVGYGPYQIAEWSPGNFIRMVKNPNYYRAGEGLPHFDNLLFRFVGGDAAANIQRVMSGECDVLDQDTQLTTVVDKLLASENNGDLQAWFTTDTVWEQLGFGIVPASFDDGWTERDDRPDYFGELGVRQAIAHCIDRNALLQAVSGGQSILTDSYVSPLHPLYNPDVATYPYDPAAGKSLLELAGWLETDEDTSTPRSYFGSNPNIPAGTPFTVRYYTTGAAARTLAAEMIQENLAECGVQIEITNWTPAEFYAEGPDGPVFGRRFDLSEFSWLNGMEPACDFFMSQYVPGSDFEEFPYFWAGWNHTGYQNESYDALCQKALDTLPGQPGYAQNHLDAQALFAEELPTIPLWLRFQAAAARPDFCGFSLDPTASSDFWNIEEYDYGDCTTQP